MEATNELGDVYAHFGSWKEAVQAWNDALDCIIGPYQVSQLLCELYVFCRSLELLRVHIMCMWHPSSKTAAVLIKAEARLVSCAGHQVLAPASGGQSGS